MKNWLKNWKTKKRNLQEIIGEQSTTISAQNDKIIEQGMEIESLNRQYTKLHNKFVESQTRNTKLEADACNIAINDLLVNYKDLHPKTEVLLISSPNPSIATHGTFANLNDRLRRLMPGLNAVLMVQGDLSFESYSSEELAQKFHLMVLPTKTKFKSAKDTFLQRFEQYVNKYSTVD